MGPYDPGIPFLGIYLPSKMKAHDHTKTYMQMFMAALFVNSPKLETTQVLNKYIDILCYTAECYSAIELINMILKMNLKIIKMSERSQSNKRGL